MVRGTTRSREPLDESGIRTRFLDQGRAHPVGNVMDLPGIESIAAIDRKEQIAFHQKEFERSRLGFRFWPGDAEPVSCLWRSSPDCAVGAHLALIYASVHTGVQVVEMEE